MLAEQVLDQQFRGIAQAMRDADPGSQQALKDMMSDLNALLEKRARGQDTDEDFAEFMSKHGEFFPGSPESLDELLD